MKMRQLMSLSVVMVVMSALISGCAGRGHLLDTVPADVMAVGLVDLKKACGDAGVEFGDKGVTVPAEVEVRLGRQTLNLLDVAARLHASGVADMTDVAIIADGAHNGYMTFFISDFDKFKELCGNNVEWTGNQDGYQTATVGALGGCNLIAVKDQVWLTGADVRAVKDLRESAGTLAVSALDGLSQALAEPHTVCLAVETGFVSRLNGVAQTTEIKAQDKNWLLVSLEQGTDGSLVAGWNEIASTGQTIRPVGLRDINPALLAYVPADYTLAAAIGVTGDFDWKPFEQIALAAGGFQGAAFMLVASPYLQSVDGTVLLAARPRTTAVADDVADWDFILLADMPRGQIQGLMNMVRTMLFTGGISPNVDSLTGIMSFPQYGGMMYMGEVDGCLGISTIPFDNTRNNPLAPTFVNKDFAVSADLAGIIPALGGLSLTASMDEGVGQAKLKVSDGSKSTLAYLLEGK